MPWGGVMSENRLIIAAAGSGKTTYLVNEALAQDGRVLILTYTLSNEDVIKRRLIQKVGCIPKNITVQTWFSFLLQHGVKPYQGSLNDSLFDQDIRGMLLVNQQSGIRYKNTNGTPVYWGESDFNRHYFTQYFKIYSDKISKFVFKCNIQSNNAVIDRLTRIYDHMFIDEVQDLAGHDLELLKLLFKSTMSVLLVGDPRQVTYLTHLERKYAKYQNGKIREFVKNELGKCIACTIDETTLGASHRCNQPICQFSSQLYPDLPETASCCRQSGINHQGIFLVKPSHLNEYVQRFTVTQLRWDRKTNVLPDMAVMNFGEAKGETFDRVLIYPTIDMAKWVEDVSTRLSDGARSKFYVALTRARYSAAIVINYDDRFDSDYLIKYNPGCAA
jgi:DNA helicase II / ATP-dependent DNA helicase PcrA